MTPDVHQPLTQLLTGRGVANASSLMGQPNVAIAIGPQPLDRRFEQSTGSAI